MIFPLGITSVCVFILIGSNLERKSLIVRRKVPDGSKHPTGGYPRSVGEPPKGSSFHVNPLSDENIAPPLKAEFIRRILPVLLNDIVLILRLRLEIAFSSNATDHVLPPSFDRKRAQP
jgi:hypothetical protein